MVEDRKLRRRIRRNRLKDLIGSCTKLEQSIKVAFSTFTELHDWNSLRALGQKRDLVYSLSSRLNRVVLETTSILRYQRENECERTTNSHITFCNQWIKRSDLISLLVYFPKDVRIGSHISSCGTRR